MPSTEPSAGGIGVELNSQTFDVTDTRSVLIPLIAMSESLTWNIVFF
jgi:hypothetical protein